MVPYDERHLIDNKSSEDFKIVWTAKNRGNQKRFFIIETTEEEVVILKLKFGSDNVWLR
jgi:hypothetical protein